MPDALMPDAALILGEHLRSHRYVTAKVGARSSTTLAATMPAIRYAIASRPRVGPEEWAVRAQVECWADVGQERAAEATARAVEASLPDLLGTRSTGEVAGADVTNAFPSTDAATKRPRVIVLLDLLVYALDPVEAL